MHNWFYVLATPLRPTNKKIATVDELEWEHIEIIKWFLSKYDLWFDEFFLTRIFLETDFFLALIECWHK